MSTTITLEGARAKLTEVADSLSLGEEIVFTQNQVPVAKLVSQRPTQRKPRVPGHCNRMITLAVEDDEHLKDFAESMSYEQQP